MSLCQKFRDAVSGAVVSISSLYQDTRYPVLHAERVETKYGTSVRLTIREADENNVKLFLPRRYSEIFTDDDLAEINNQTVHYYLIYKGKSSANNSFIIQFEV